MDISRTSILNTITGNTVTRANPAAPQKQSSEHTVRPSNPTADTVSISKTAHALHDGEVKAVDPVDKIEEDNIAHSGQKTDKNQNAVQLSEEDLKQVQELKERDQEVRTHEAAHLAAAGKYATGGPSYEYKRGPDGKNYAVGGEVGIDTSAIPGDPQATLQKAQQIRAAAQAPANPSSQDRAVAASAAQMEAKARQEIAEQSIEETSSNKIDSNESNSGSDTKASADGNEENNSTSQKATSAYQAVNQNSKTENDIPSLIDLVA